MSVGKALEFIRKIDTDEDFRRSCYQYKTKEELKQAFDFDSDEFDDAKNMLLVKCQTYEEADLVNEIQMWYNIFK
jgi:hypothetical protein